MVNFKRASQLFFKSPIKWVLLSLGLMYSTVHAQNQYPSKPIKIVTPFAVGSVSDISIRHIGNRLGQRIKTQILIENITGAGGVSAAKLVLSAPNDGYSIALLSSATALSVSLIKNYPIHPSTDFTAIASISDFANVIASNPTSKFTDFAKFIKEAQANPGKLNIGTTVIGTSTHMTANLFKSVSGLSFQIIPYKGPSELFIALMRGDVDLIVQSYGGLKDHIDNQQVHPIGVSSSKRVPTLPNTPTIEEYGFKNFEVSTWNGFFAVQSTPEKVINFLNNEVNAILKEADTIKRFSELGIEPKVSSPQELGERMKSEIEKWNKVVRTMEPL